MYAVDSGAVGGGKKTSGTTSSNKSSSNSTSIFTKIANALTGKSSSSSSSNTAKKTTTTTTPKTTTTAKTTTTTQSPYTSNGGGSVKATGTTSTNKGTTTTSTTKYDGSYGPYNPNTYLGNAKIQAATYAANNNLPSDQAQKLVSMAGTTTLEKQLYAQKQLDQLGINGTVKASSPNVWTGGVTIETKNADGDTVLTDFDTGEQTIVPSIQTMKNYVAQAKANEANASNSTTYNTATSVSNNAQSYYDDLMAIFMEQNEAARNAALDAILQNLNAVKGTYKSQIQEVMDEYDALVNENEISKDRARRRVKENQANRGQLDSGLGRQEQLDLDIGYDNKTADLKLAREKAVNEIYNLIAQAEAEANTNKANVNNTYNNALLEYQIANS